MCVRKGGKVGGGGGELEVGVCTMYCGYDDTLKMKVPWEEDCTISGGSSLQSLTVHGKNVLFL